MTSKRQQVCEKCGYNKHVETCHIQDIGSFDTDTLIKEVNVPENLALLCPNCHWELDHKLVGETRIELVT